MRLTAFHHVCIQTDQYAKSLEFYVKGMGFRMLKESKNFHDREFNTWLKSGDIMIELQTPKAGEELRPWSNQNSGPVHLAFVVHDVTTACEALQGLGFRNFKTKNGKEIYEVLGSRLFKIRAPEGTEIEIRESAEI